MKIEKNERLLNEAVREMESDKDFYPDANSTMRFSFGMIGGYSPKDALEYTYYTTTKGIFDKIREYKGDSDFEVMPSVIDLLENRDFGRYAAEDGNMNVCFISDNDITEKVQCIQTDKKSEKQKVKHYDQVDLAQISLFDTTKDEDVIKELSQIDISNLTPLDALNTLYKLQNMLKNRWSSTNE